MIKGIIFDYDGTISDSIDIKTQAFAELYKPYGSEIVDKVVDYHIANGGVSRFEKIKYFHKQFLNKNLRPEKILEISNSFSKLVIKNVIIAPYITGAYEFISTNHGYRMFISTATPQDEIITILTEKKIIKYFDIVLGSPTSKSQHIKIIIKQFKYSSNELVYIGDSLSDQEAAEDNKTYFIAIDNEEKFDQETLMIKDFRSLSPLLKTLNSK
tara:strand:- start:12089 stop:12727 length:639 start_codon:yes stop_codon:yes gene_type:complete